MIVAILGSGGGGLAVAHDFSTHGHEVRLYDFANFPDNIKAVKRNGGIFAEGDLTGFTPVKYSGHNISETVKGAELIMVVGPAYSTKPFAETCKPHLEKGQVVIVCPSSCGGSVEFKNSIGIPVKDEGILVAETNTLPYAVRVTEPGRIRVFLKLRGGLFLAALPTEKTDNVLNMVRDVYPHLLAAKNIMQTSLQNGNPVIHPAITLMNVGLIERTGGDFYFSRARANGCWKANPISIRRRLVILAIGLVAARASTTAGVIILLLDCASVILILTWNSNLGIC